jgi:hypothetical protein
MKILSFTIIASCLIFCAAASQANDSKDLDRTAAEINAHAKTPGEQIHVLTAISGETGVPVATLQAQQSQTRFGYGELLIANSLASATGKTFDEIAALKASGQGWGKIAKTYHLKLGPIVSQSRRTQDAVSPAESKSKAKSKGDDNDFFIDKDKGAGQGRDFEHGQGRDMDQGDGNTDHGSDSHGKSHGHGKGGG